MGLFSTTLSIYGKDQSEIIDALKRELKDSRKLATSDKITFTSDNFQDMLNSQVYSHPGVFYLISERWNNWTTITELNVNIEDPFYLYEMVNSMSLRLKTYSLSFHLHDDDVLLYNLDYDGASLDGYSSDVQYFEKKPLKRNEVIDQRHSPEEFLKILPKGKDIGGLIEILNRGYWQAFDNHDLDKDGIPDDDKYDVDEEQRLKEIGCYLEIYNDMVFPYANWYEDLPKLDLSKYYLMRAER